MSDQKREYLEARVQTANSAQLHLMLLDGALRFGREAEKGVLRGDELAFQPPLLRSLDIVGELLAGVRHSTDELNEKLAQLYAFVYTRLTTAYVNADKQAIAEALKVLEIERETWSQAVGKLAAEPDAAPAKPVATRHKAPAPKPHLDAAPATEAGLSLEA